MRTPLPKTTESERATPSPSTVVIPRNSTISYYAGINWDYVSQFSDGWAHHSMTIKQICIMLTQMIPLLLGFWGHLRLVGSSVSLGSHVLSKSVGWVFRGVDPLAPKVDE